MNPRLTMTDNTQSLVTGVSLEGFLQFIEQERKSATLAVHSNVGIGMLHLDDGQLKAAFFRDLEGTAALWEILSWDSVVINVESVSTHPVNIHTSLAGLLLEAARVRDEAQQADEVWVDMEHPIEAKSSPKELNMANVQSVLEEAMSIEGAVGAALADYKSGMALGVAGGGVNLDVAAAGNSEVVKSKIATMRALGINDTIEDILITLGKQYHMIRLLDDEGLFLYLVLDRQRANLAMARHKLSKLGHAVAI